VEEQLEEKLENYQFSTPKDKLGYAEEFIVVKSGDPKEDLLLNYSLSNSLDDIKIAIFKRTELNIKIEKAKWVLNSNLSVSVKHLMNKHQVLFSMTTYDETIEKRIIKSIIINMRVGDNWFFTQYCAIRDKIYTMDYFETLDKLKRFIEKYLSEDDIED